MRPETKVSVSSGTRGGEGTQMGVSDDRVVGSGDARGGHSGEAGTGNTARVTGEGIIVVIVTESKGTMIVGHDNGGRRGVVLGQFGFVGSGSEL